MISLSERQLFLSCKEMYEYGVIYITNRLNLVFIYKNVTAISIANCIRSILALDYSRSRCNYTKRSYVKILLPLLNVVGLTTSTNEIFHLSKKRVIAFLRNEFRLLEQI